MPTRRGMEPTTGRSAYMSHGRTKTKHQRHANAALLNALSTPAGLLSLVTGGICHASSEARHLRPSVAAPRSEEHTSELQSQSNLVCRLLLEKKNNAQT